MGKQIIGIDISNGGDCSCINSICTKCKTAIETKLYKSNENNLGLTVFRICPNCGVKFKNHIIHSSAIEE